MYALLKTLPQSAQQPYLKPQNNAKQVTFIPILNVNKLTFRKLEILPYMISPVNDVELILWQLFQWFLSFIITKLKTYQSLSLDPQSCSTLCDPMNRSMPGLPVHHQLLEFTQTHADRVSDAIEPSHPLSSPCPPAFNLP